MRNTEEEKKRLKGKLQCLLFASDFLNALPDRIGSQIAMNTREAMMMLKKNKH